MQKTYYNIKKQKKQMQAREEQKGEVYNKNNKKANAVT